MYARRQLLIRGRIAKFTFDSNFLRRSFPLNLIEASTSNFYTTRARKLNHTRARKYGSDHFRLSSHTRVHIFENFRNFEKLFAPARRLIFLLFSVLYFENNPKRGRKNETIIKTNGKKKVHLTSVFNTFLHTCETQTSTMFFPAFDCIRCAKFDDNFTHSHKKRQIKNKSYTIEVITATGNVVVRTSSYDKQKKKGYFTAHLLSLALCANSRYRVSRTY